MARVIPLLGFVLTVVAVAVQGCNVPSQFVGLAAKVRAICIAESGVSEDMIDDTCNGNLPDDPKLKCYTKCIASQLEMINADESINYDIVIGMIPEEMKERAIHAVNSCVNETGTDMCDKVWNVVKCMAKVDPQDFFMP